MRAARATTRLARGLVMLGVAAAAAATPGAAHASAYSYWSYWHGDANGNWTYSQVGASGYRPSNGTFEGWRWLVSSSEADATPPRSTPSFASVCGTSATATGYKKVAVVIDYGSGAGAPGERAKCAVDVTSAKGDRILNDVASVTVATSGGSAGLVCAIDAYPDPSCGATSPKVDHSPAPPSAPSTSAPPPVSTHAATTTRPTTAATTARAQASAAASHNPHPASAAPDVPTAPARTRDPVVRIGDAPVTATAHRNGPGVATVTGVLAIALLAVATAILARRRRSA